MTEGESPQRIDKLLVELGLAESRTKAQALVMAGDVLVDEKRVEKPSESFTQAQNIRLKSDSKETRYAGRGGLKLEHALKKFHIRPAGYECIDIGSSTGGFTDCLLQHGARHVTAVDSGTNQLIWRLRNDERVSVRENTNARYLSAEHFGQRFDLVTVDVSFISAAKLMPVLADLLRPGGSMIVLVKPQFELEKRDVGKGGIVRDAEKHREAVDSVSSAGRRFGLIPAGVVRSPITGARGNVEFLALFKKEDEER